MLHINKKQPSKLAPSKSTVYVGNLPFSLTNNDLHKVFEAFGEVVKVTIVKDKLTRKSKGVAFVLFLEKLQAENCVLKLNDCEMFGRKLKASIAKDNGRAAEFIRRREYPDKSRCYECGETGHLSYNCSKNVLGPREKLPKKKAKGVRIARPKMIDELDLDEESLEDSEEGVDSWGAAVRYQLAVGQQRLDTDSEQLSTDLPTGTKRPRIRRDTYFSDEECLDDDD